MACVVTVAGPAARERSFQMRIETRFLAIYLPAIAAVMTAYALLVERRREALVLAEVHQETELYANALATAIGSTSASWSSDDVLPLLNQLGITGARYVVVVYSAAGVPTLTHPRDARLPPPLGQIASVRTQGRPVSWNREGGDHDFYSILLPIREHDSISGALEISRSLDAVAADRATVRRHFIYGTVTLWVVVGILTIWLLRRSIGNPLRRFALAVQAVGRGDLSYRVNSPRGTTELDALVSEFNRMAERLEHARTDLLRESEERVTLERRLHQSEKMMTLGGLSAGLAHQIAGPLNVIAGRAELLAEAPLANGDRRNLEIITEQVERLSRIVRSLLDMARRRELRLEVADFNKVVDEALQSLDSELQRAGITVVRDGPPDASFVGDAELLREAVVNLVRNAVEALASANGTRRVAIRVDEERQEKARYITCEVADTGPGLSTNALRRLFEPLFTTKRRGHGLGLVTARGIVEEHGGVLEGANAPDGGAVFRIRLPADPRTDSHG